MFIHHSKNPHLDYPDSILQLENGNYLNNCSICKLDYAGPKRSVVCYRCETEAKAKWDALTPEQQEKELAEKYQMLNEFFAKLKKEQVDTPPEIAKVINEKFHELL